MLSAIFNRIFGGVLLIAVVSVLPGCATNGQPLSTEQKIGRCVGGILLTTALCRLAGDQKLAKQCAVASIAACAVWLVYNNAQDKKRIANARQRALETGQAQQDEWRNDGDGRMRKVSVSLRPDQMLNNGQPCRTVDIEAASEGTEGLGKHTETYCRTSEGNWAPQATNV